LVVWLSAIGWLFDCWLLAVDRSLVRCEERKSTKEDSDWMMYWICDDVM
jgi:hypothetical protein